MSLPINPSDVVAVLLSDGWHIVKDGSFAVDAYAYVESYAGAARRGPRGSGSWSTSTSATRPSRVP